MRWINELREVEKDKESRWNDFFIWEFHLEHLVSAGTNLRSRSGFETVPA